MRSYSTYIEISKDWGSKAKKTSTFGEFDADSGGFQHYVGSYNLK